MLKDVKNLVEDIVIYYVDNTLAFRYDICTCPICKADTYGYILAKIPPRYVRLDDPLLLSLVEKAKLELRQEISGLINSAIEAIAKNPRHVISDDKKKYFDLILNKIYNERGLDFKYYRQELLKRRLALRISSNKLNSYDEYIKLLNKDPEEYDRLLEVLCINVSEFFRDPEIWITAKYLFESLLLKKKEQNDRSLKVWSAGSANGEETYSIAIILKEILKEDLNKYSVEIYGTDIDKKCLKDALTAKYAKEQLKNVSEEYLNKYFILLEDQKYKLKQEITGMVKFQYLELSSEDFLKDVDVIFCRNVFIYFYRDMQNKILLNFYNALKPKGYLIMGKVETIVSGAKDIFKEIDSEARFYQKA